MNEYVEKNRHSSNDGEETPGQMKIFGMVFQGIEFFPFLYSLMISIALAVVFTMFKFSIWMTSFLALLPTICTVLYQGLFILGKPHGYKDDLLKYITEGNCSYCAPQFQPPHPFKRLQGKENGVNVGKSETQREVV
jgi:hypothetical protein